MHLHDLLGWPGPLTHRQFIGWMMWLGEQWNEPDRGDHYEMQTAAEIRQFRHSFIKGAPRVHIKHLKLKFTARDQETTPSKTIEERGKVAEASWMARLGIVGPKANQPRERRDPAPGLGGKAPLPRRGAALSTSTPSPKVKGRPTPRVGKPPQPTLPKHIRELRERQRRGEDLP